MYFLKKVVFLKSGAISDIAIEISAKKYVFWYQNIKNRRNSGFSTKFLGKTTKFPEKTTKFLGKTTKFLVKRRNS